VGPIRMYTFRRADDLAAGILLAAVAVALVYRVTIGVDLSDEGYYLTFVDGWLKTGVAGSDTLMLHQTSQLVLYPLIKFWSLLTGGVDGLALVMRSAYLLTAGASAFCFYAFIRTQHCRSAATLGATLAISFVPFSLPAPSYNTLGMFGMMAALSALGTYAVTKRPVWCAVSAIAWTVGVIAYPTLVAVFVPSLVVVLIFVPGLTVRRRWEYVGACLAVQAIGVGLVIAALGVDKLTAIVQFTNGALEVSEGLHGKLLRALEALRANPVFTGLCIVALGVGASGTAAGGARFRATLSLLLLAAIVLAASAVEPVMFVKSHDLVSVILLAGIGCFLVRLVIRSFSLDIETALFGLSVLAALVTSATATHGIFNFAIGAFFGSALFLIVVFNDAAPQRSMRLALGALVATLLVGGTFAKIYGEIENPLMGASARVESGVFQGLLTTATKADAIASSMGFLAKLPGATITVLGRLPGFYTLVEKHPSALTTWNFDQAPGRYSWFEQRIVTFYTDPKNTPDVVIVVDDPWTQEPFAGMKKLLERYTLIGEEDLGVWSLKAYGREAKASKTPDQAPSP
jgi:hypothetical protein